MERIFKSRFRTMLFDRSSAIDVLPPTPFQLKVQVSIFTFPVPYFSLILFFSLIELFALLGVVGNIQIDRVGDDLCVDNKRVSILGSHEVGFVDPGRDGKPWLRMNIESSCFQVSRQVAVYCVVPVDAFCMSAGALL